MSGIKTPKQLTSKVRSLFSRVWNAPHGRPFFRFLIVGLGFSLSAMLLMMMANFNDVQRAFIGARAGEFTNDKPPLNVWIEGDGPWQIKANGKDGNARYVAYYVRLADNESDLAGMSFPDLDKNEISGDDLVNLSKTKGFYDGIARLVKEDKKNGVMLNGTVLFTVAQKKPIIKEAYVYEAQYANENPNSITSLAEVRLSVFVPVANKENYPTTPPSPTTAAANNSCPQPGEQTYVDTFSSSIGASPQNPKCVCNKSYTVVDMKNCSGSPALNPTATRAPAQPTSSQPSQNANGCPQPGEQTYVDTFSSSIGASAQNPKCVCNKSYAVVDMKNCSQSAPANQPPATNSGSTGVRTISCYSNEYCAAVGAGNCTNGSCGQARKGTCSKQANAPDETKENTQCKNLNSSGSGSTGGSQPANQPAASGKICGNLPISYWDNKCICTDNTTYKEANALAGRTISKEECKSAAPTSYVD